MTKLELIIVSIYGIIAIFVFIELLLKIIRIEKLKEDENLGSVLFTYFVLMIMWPVLLTSLYYRNKRLDKETT